LLVVTRLHLTVETCVALAGLSVYEIVVQEMAERTLRGEIAELGRHILQKSVFGFPLLCNSRKLLSHPLVLHFPELR
jgi:hypothetical protein